MELLFITVQQKKQIIPLHPLEEDMILDLLNSPEHREEDERTLKEVWERMKKENKKKTKGKK